MNANAQTNNKLGAICTAIGLTATIVSILLTSLFMIKIGGSDNILVYIFVTLGASLDIVKQILPVIIFIAIAQKKNVFATLLGFLYLAMATVSFIATSSAVENRINENLQVSIQSKASSEQISLIKGQLNNYRMLFNEQKLANQVTKMSKTSNEISKLSARLIELTKKSSNEIPKDNILSHGKKILIVAIAILVEVLSPTMWLCILMLDTKNNHPNNKTIVDEFEQQCNDTQNNTYINKRTNSAIDTSNTSVKVQKKPIYKVENIKKHNKLSTTQETESTKIKQQKDKVFDKENIPVVLNKNSTQKNKQVESKIIQLLKNVGDDSALLFADLIENHLHGNSNQLTMIDKAKIAVATGGVAPNFRDIQSKYKLDRDEVKQCLKALADYGILLCGKGNRYKLQTT